MAISLAAWKSPYSGADIASFATPEAIQTVEGEILLLRVSECESTLDSVADAASLPETARLLRQRFPGSPVAVWIQQTASAHVIDLVRAATRSQIRAILGGPAPDPERLRFELTEPRGLGAFVLRWATDAGYLPQSGIETEIRVLLDVPPGVRTLQRLARDRREATRTWRSHLRQSGLPAPRAWLGLAHTLRLAFHLQRNRDQSLQRAAECLGYSDVTLMSHRFRHVFRMPPGAARALLGAEPLLNRWFQGTMRGVRP